MSVRPECAGWATTGVGLRGLGFQVVTDGVAAQGQAAGVFEGPEPTERR